MVPAGVVDQTIAAFALLEEEISSSTAAIPITWTTSGARRNLPPKKFITWMWAPVAVFGAWNAVTA